MKFSEKGRQVCIIGVKGMIAEQLIIEYNGLSFEFFDYLKVYRSVSNLWNHL